MAIQRGCSARSRAAGERDSVEGGEGGTLGSAVMGRNCERLCEDGRGLSFFLNKIWWGIAIQRRRFLGGERLVGWIDIWIRDTPCGRPFETGDNNQLVHSCAVGFSSEK